MQYYYISNRALTVEGVHNLWYAEFRVLLQPYAVRKYVVAGRYIAYFNVMQLVLDKTMYVHVSPEQLIL